jgi:C-terminal processing protease CtpA/Prc
MAERRTVAKANVARFSRLIIVAVTVALTGGGANAAEEPILKPDVPKLDAAEKPSTLKGTVEHRLAAPTQPKKSRRLNSEARQSDSPLAGAMRAQRDRERAMKLKAREQAFALQQQQQYMLPQSVGIIGVKFFKLADGPAVINHVFSGTPAARAGMQTDDQIVAVDGVPTRNLSKDQCYDLIVGSPNTPITISVLRNRSFEAKQMVRMDFNDIPDPIVRRDYLNSL